MTRVSTRFENEVAIVLLDDAATRNAMSVDQMDDLAAAIRDVGRKGLRALVLGASGPTFCAGADLRLLRDALAGEPERELGALVEAVNHVVLALQELPCPSVAAVDGPAVGAGMAVALAADLRVVGPDARFIPGFLAIGASPDSGTSYFLTRALGGARATAFIVRNRPIDAETIVAWGLAEAAIGDGDALEAAVALAKDLGRLPRRSLVSTRRVLDAAPTNVLVEQLAIERETIGELWSTADYREGVAAFLDRRQPQWITTD